MRNSKTADTVAQSAGTLSNLDGATDALRREIEEETGLTNVTFEKPIFVGEWFPTIKSVPTHIVAMFHFCSTNDSDVVLSSEHDKFLWVASHEWQNLDVMDPEDLVLEKAFKELLAS